MVFSWCKTSNLLGDELMVCVLLLCDFQVVSFLRGFVPNLCTVVSFIVLHTPPSSLFVVTDGNTYISFNLIIFGVEYK